MADLFIKLKHTANRELEASGEYQLLSSLKFNLKMVP
jgi:hypothetical protein